MVLVQVLGFLPPPPPTATTWAHNLPSVVGMEDVVQSKIDKEV